MKEMSKEEKYLIVISLGTQIYSKVDAIKEAKKHVKEYPGFISMYIAKVVREIK